ncbi:MAG: hypothetical protein KAH32_04360, partial [Chlamydiia bacterium]|nr:hypothetical protein [Chlamydiia bacterium]
YFRMKYLGYSQQKSNVQIATTNPLVFATLPMVVKLKSSTGAPLSTGEVKYYASGWKTFGVTDASGQATMELLPGKYYFRMKFRGYSQQKSNIQIATTNPLTFTTLPMVVALQKCDGTGLVGGAVSYYASGWKTFGVTDANGDATYELLPGKYYFRMKYNGKSNQKSNIQIATTNPLVYTTTHVSLTYGGTIKYYASGWKVFTQPSMDMLPGNYYFRFGSSQTTLNITGCNFSQSIATVQFKNSNGQPIANAGVKYRYGWGAGTAMSNTDSQGKSVYMSANTNSNVKFTITYRGGSKEKSHNISVNPIVDFNTVNVVPELYNSLGTLISTDVNFKYRYAWETKMDIPTDGELLPVNTKFTVYYRGSFKEKTFNLSNNTNVDFNTVNVIPELYNSLGNLITSDVNFKYRYGWETVMNIPTDGELLPLNTRFTVYYRGSFKEKTFYLSSNTNVDFNTVNVVPKLYNSLGNLITSDVNFKYRYGWETEMNIPTDGELLPLNTRFTVYYRGSFKEKTFYLSS